METFMIERPVTKESYLWTLLRESGVSFLQAENYFNNNQDDLKNIANILESNNDEDIWECFALLHILTHGVSYGMVKKYCLGNSKKLRILNNPEQSLLGEIIRYTEKYKISLMAALTCDDAFFNKVIKWYKRIYAFKEIIPVRFESKKVDLLAADPNPDIDAKEIPIAKIHIDDILEKYCGYLFLIENKQKRRLEALFQFLDKETNKIIDTAVPGYFQIVLVLNDDANSEYPISLDREMTTIQAAIHSGAIYNVDLSRGFTVSPPAIKDKGKTL